MATSLDISALRSLTAIADCGGYHRAAEVLGTTQSTVSQHVRKLETVLGCTLLERDGRGRRFTVEGESLLVEARTLVEAHDDIVRRYGRVGQAALVLGSTEHSAEYLLPVVSRAVAGTYADRPLRFRIDRGRSLDAALDRGTVDVALLIGRRHPDSAAAGALPLTWCAAPGWTAPPAGDPIPLVVIDGPCTIRRKALATLSEAGVPHTIVAEAGHLSGVVDAVRAGLGVALLTSTGEPPERIRARHDLPTAAPEPLHVRLGAGSPDALRELVTSAVRDALEHCSPWP